MVQWLNLAGIAGAIKAIAKPGLMRPSLRVKGEERRTSHCLFSVLFRSFSHPISPLDISKIDWAQLKDTHNIRAVAFDKDNCLTLPYAHTIHPGVDVCFSFSLSLFSFLFRSPSHASVLNGTRTHIYLSLYIFLISHRLRCRLVLRPLAARTLRWSPTRPALQTTPTAPRPAPSVASWAWLLLHTTAKSRQTAWATPSSPISNGRESRGR